MRSKEHRRGLAALLLAALAAAGCTGTDRTVSVTVIDRVWQEDATSETQPADALKAVRLVPGDGSPALDGVRTAAGTWTIGRVPAGPFIVDATFLDGHHLFLEADADAIDLGGDGFPWLALTSPATSVGIPLAGLLPWRGASDRLQYYAHAIGGADAFTPALEDGATSGTAAYEWPFAERSIGSTTLLERADVVHAVQQRAATIAATGDTVRVAVAAASTSGVELTRTGDNLLPLHFAAPAASRSIRLRWSAGAFAAATPGVSDPVRTSLAVAAVPGPAPWFTGAGLELLSVEPPAAGALADRDDGTATYRRATPKGWREYLDAQCVRSEPRLAPGAAAPVQVWASTRVTAPAEAVPDPIAPAVSAVRDVTVAGRDASQVQDGVGDGPVLAWSAPATGTPTSVRVDVYEFLPRTMLSIKIAAAFVTTRTSVQVPAGTLVAGKAYLARITAVASPSDRAGVAPYRLRPPWTQVEQFTEVFTP